MAVSLELIVSCTLGKVHKYIVVEEMLMVQCEVAGGLEPEGLADLDILKAFRANLTMFDEGVVVALDPERSLA